MNLSVDESESTWCRSLNDTNSQENYMEVLHVGISIESVLVPIIGGFGLIG